MQWFQLKAKLGALALTGLMLIPAILRAQTILPAQTPPITVTVEDTRGAALPGAAVTDPAGTLLGRTDASGKLTLACTIPCRIRVAAPGFAGISVQIGNNAVVQLLPAANSEQVTVSAYRTPLGSLESPVATRLLTQKALSTTAAPTLDDQLRQLPGVELFRRSSSLSPTPPRRV